jgi:hypothetical protein
MREQFQITHILTAQGTTRMADCLRISNFDFLCAIGVRTGPKLRAGRPGFHSRQGKKLLLFLTASIPTLGFTQPLYNCYCGRFLRGLRGREVNLTTHIHFVSRSRIMNYISLTPHVFMAQCSINKTQGHRTVALQLMKFSVLYGTRSSLPCSQNPATDIYTRPVESSSHLPSYISKIHICIIFPSMSRFF